MGQTIVLRRLSSCHGGRQTTKVDGLSHLWLHDGCHGYRLRLFGPPWCGGTLDSGGLAKLLEGGLDVVAKACDVGGHVGVGGEPEEELAIVALYGNAETQFKSALTQLAESYKKTLAPINCS